MVIVSPGDLLTRYLEIGTGLKILAIDTSTDACSVALMVDGAVCNRCELGRQHSSRVLSMLDELLVESGLALTQLDAVAFGRGPGLFTGLRIGAGVVQGLAFGADLPVVPVSSLAALAQGLDTERTLSAFDARMSQVYWGAYVRNAQGMVELVGGECVVAPQCVPLPETGGWHGGAVAGTSIPTRWRRGSAQRWWVGAATVIRWHDMWRNWAPWGSSTGAQWQRKTRCPSIFATRSQPRRDRVDAATCATA